MRQLLADYRSPDASRRIDFAGEGSEGQICEQIEQYGFAVARLEGAGRAPDAALEALSRGLDLGDPVVPALYRRAGAGHYSNPLVDIVSDPHSTHPGFHTAAGQDWHVDGLLDALGDLRTSVLYCLGAASEGGDTLVFNAVAAFAELAGTDPEAADALTSPSVLERRATLPGVDASAVGPAFARLPGGALATRFTDNDTCVWHESVGPPGSVRRGLDHLRAAAADPRYRLALRLTPGEALIFRNDRLSHGRTAYRDAPQSRRHLVRILYNRAPRTARDRSRVTTADR